MGNSILNNFNLFNKKDNFYFEIKKLLKFTPNSIHYYKTAFTHRSLNVKDINGCLLYTSPSPRDRQKSRMPSSA